MSGRQEDWESSTTASNMTLGDSLSPLYANTGDLGSIPGLGRSPGKRNGYLLQYSGLENNNPMDRGAWWATVHGVANNWQNEVGQTLTEFCQENVLVIANTLFQQHKR